MVISHKYKNTLDDLIDNSDLEFLDRLEVIDKGSCNMFRSKGSLMGLLEEDCLNKDYVLISNKSSQLVLKTKNSQIY